MEENESSGYVSDVNASVDFDLVNSWSDGFEGQISVTNNTDSNLDTWTLEFDFPNEITDIWDAEIVSREGDRYTIKNVSWNREIESNETITFGFLGSDTVTTEPENFEVDGTLFDSPSVDSSLYSYSDDISVGSELEVGVTYQGRATFYDAANPSGGIGASGYDVPPESELDEVTAINNDQWNGSEASGAFFEVWGPKQREGSAEPIVVQVTDLLYERSDGLDLSEQAFEKVADPVEGVINIEYQLVGPADNFVTPYGYRIGDGIVVEGISETNPYYAAVRLNNHRYPIESIDLITEDGSLVDFNRESDNRFVLDGNYPLYGEQDLLVTDIFGQEVTINDVDITNGSSEDIVTGEQFRVI